MVKAIKPILNKGLEVELRLAGPITNASYGNKIEQYIKDNNLSNNVKLLGNLSSQDIIKELEAATVFSLLSLEENSPMGIEEAMAVGVPVVTSNRCGMPYMVRHYESGFLVDPNDIDDVVDRLSALLGKPDAHKKMSQKCVEIAKDRFHPDLIAQRTVRVYEECIKQFSRLS